MTNHEAFRFGFLLRCADEGLSSEQIDARVKQASAIKTADGIMGSWGNAPGALGALWDAIKSTTALGLAGSGLAGAGIGYTLANATAPSVTPEDVKQQELALAYKQQAERLRRLRKLRAYRDMGTAPRPAQITG